MRKTLRFSGLILTFIFFGTLSSCKKNNQNHNEDIKYDVKYYSKKFLSDSSFTVFFKALVTNSFELNKMLGTNESRSSLRATETIDSAAAYDAVAEIVTAEVMLQNVHPQFFQLTLEEQQIVCNNVCEQLTDEEYRRENPSDPLVIYGTETIAYLNEYGPVMRKENNRVTGMDITWGEFSICTAGAFGAALGEYGGIVGEVWRIFTQGSQYLTWGGVFQIASKIVKNAVPWYKVASVAFGYATCLWAAA